MTRFMFAVDLGAVGPQQDAVLVGLAARFPDIEFKLMEPEQGSLNTIIPMIGEPEWDDPDQTTLQLPTRAVIDEVRQTFEGLVGHAGHLPK
jgi:hypothetical protein